MMMRTEELKARLCQLALKNMFEVSQKVFCKALSNRKVIDPATACFFDFVFSFMCVVILMWSSVVPRFEMNPCQMQQGAFEAAVQVGMMMMVIIVRHTG